MAKEQTSLDINISFDDEKLREAISRTLMLDINTAIRHESTFTRGIISAFIKEMLYAKKDEIIEMVVERASSEMVRKGMPKLLERIEIK